MVETLETSFEGAKIGVIGVNHDMRYKEVKVFLRYISPDIILVESRPSESIGGVDEEKAIADFSEEQNVEVRPVDYDYDVERLNNMSKTEASIETILEGASVENPKKSRERAEKGLKDEVYSIVVEKRESHMMSELIDAMNNDRFNSIVLVIGINHFPAFKSWLSP